jgi:hypothetical protein
MISAKFVLFLGLVFCLLNPQKVMASNLEGTVISYATVTEQVHNSRRQLRFRSAYMDSLHVLGKPKFKIVKDRLFVLIPLHLFGKSSDIAPFIDCTFIVPENVKTVFFGRKSPVEIWPKNSVNSTHSEQEQIVLNFVKQIYSSQNPGKSVEDCYYIVEPGDKPNELKITVATYDKDPTTIYTIDKKELKVVQKHQTPRR